MTAVKNLSIIKAGGHCADGCGWTFCPYMEDSHYNKYENNEPVKGTLVCKCTLFNVELQEPSRSLNMCNTVYGLFYEGKP